jgi:hypothetical protein
MCGAVITRYHPGKPGREARVIGSGGGRQATVLAGSGRSFADHSAACRAVCALLGVDPTVYFGQPHTDAVYLWVRVSDTDWRERLVCAARERAA